MSADGDQSTSKLFEVPATLSLLSNDSPVHSLDLRLILPKIIVQVDDVKSHVLVEERKSSRGRKSPTDSHDHVFRSQGSRRVGRVRLNADVHGPGFAVDLEVNEKLLFYRRLDRPFRSYKYSDPLPRNHCLDTSLVDH